MSEPNSKLYYDGQCPLCAVEMRHLDDLKQETLELVDIHSLELSAEEKTARLLLLHYEQVDGTTLTGLDANVAAWQHTRWGWAFRWTRWPVIRQIADRVYRFWAEIRYRKLYEPKQATSKA